MALVHSFAPIADKNAEVLVLGSMPGQASLDASQYYAHRHNAFWRIIAELLRFDVASPYTVRIKALKAARIALWDVLQSCTRVGSLDSMIQSDTQMANDFRTFFREHPQITRVFFNGVKAKACFERHVLARIDDRAMTYALLPSTSPANASLSFEQKLSAWRRIVDHPKDVVKARRRSIA